MIATLFPGLATPDILWLCAATFTAGLVRGFAGFGTAMIYLPVAGQILSPFAAIVTMAIFDLVAPLPLIPRTWRDGHPRDVFRLATGFLIALPFGFWMLAQMPPATFRYLVSILALIMLACLIGGIRYRGTLTRPMIYGTGGLSGILTGLAGLPGPPVILLYMARPLPSHVIRANTFLFLICVDFLIIPTLAILGRMEFHAMLIGAALIVPCLAGNLIGALLFRPGYERVYRSVAYAIIATSALSGLPLWD